MNILEEKIEKALEEVRPFLQSDGGDIHFVRIEGKTAVVEFTGSCISCTVNQMTLKNGVEFAIKKHAPEIENVINI